MVAVCCLAAAFWLSTLSIVSLPVSRKSATCGIGDAFDARSVVLVKASADQALNRIEHGGGFFAAGLHGDGGTWAGGQHHQSHDRGAAHACTAARHDRIR